MSALGQHIFFSFICSHSLSPISIENVHMERGICASIVFVFVSDSLVTRGQRPKVKVDGSSIDSDPASAAVCRIYLLTYFHHVYVFCAMCGGGRVFFYTILLSWSYRVWGSYLLQHLHTCSSHITHPTCTRFGPKFNSCSTKYCKKDLVTNLSNFTTCRDLSQIV